MHENKKQIFSDLLFILYLALLISVIFSFRAISSLTVPLILAAGLAKNKIEKNKFFRPALKNPFIVAAFVFFLIQLMSLFYANDIHQAERNILAKTYIVVIPLGIFCCDYLTTAVRKKILSWYCIFLFAACFILLCHALYVYQITHKTSVFLYHTLVSIYSGHAIQFSILVFVAVVHLFERLNAGDFIYRRYFHFFLIPFFSVFLVLLSSKLVIIFFLVFFIYAVTRAFFTGSLAKGFILLSMAALIIFSAIIFFIPNPVNNRFNEIIRTDFNFLKKREFNPGEYFNGLQFRMLQWRFVPQVLDSNKAWVAGVSVGDAQSLLNQKYISEDMYVGSAAKSDTGFIGYNTHNEFLESLLQSGIPGLLAFMAITGVLIRMAWQQKRADLAFVTILLVVYSFTESVFESQYSLLIYLFFPLFFYPEKRHKS